MRQTVLDIHYFLYASIPSFFLNELNIPAYKKLLGRWDVQPVGFGFITVSNEDAFLPFAVQLPP